ncbi:uncharacterized protein LOC143243309 [Tachypleus tridentatus]|uniref:uncharacterized protein LOC143243309 n=1 Tax=Tachypleus tridentatus TaxID=6853 RepID=UPI003FD169C6
MDFAPSQGYGIVTNNMDQLRDRPRSGRPRVTTPLQDHYIRLRHLRDRTTTATSTASTVLLHIRGNLTDFAFADFGCSAVTVQSFTHVTQNYRNKLVNNMSYILPFSVSFFLKTICFESH